MTTSTLHKYHSPVASSCYTTLHREGEQFIPEFVFSYQVSGTMVMNDGQQSYTFHPGEYRLGRRNHLMKFQKIPPEGGEFKSLSVQLDQPFLRSISLEAGEVSTSAVTRPPVICLPPDPLFKNYFDSLPAYLPLHEKDDVLLVTLKLREAVLLLLKVDPTLKDILFDFSDPGKIDLEAFMHQNYHFNVPLQRFAYLTGRSLATFKRDFEKIFHITPSRWLLQRRLQEAHYLIREKGLHSADIYLDLGFEDLSHFSFAFRKQFGVAPTKIIAK